MKYGLRVAISTDNRVISRVTVTDEYMSLMKICDIDAKGLRNICLAGFKGAFFPGTYAQHREYMRRSIDFYDETYKKHVLGQ
ncbi:MAG TPA: hypothetical protein DC017_11340 [Candidatus Wallbacteria bacterium]|nr:hypothetical protein [Candidatus Wallbacteria bacterium]